MSKLDQIAARNHAAMVEGLRLLEDNAAEVLRRKGSIDAALPEIMPQLRSFLRADGFAFQYGTQLFTDGNVPPRAFIFDLIHGANQHRTERRSFHTTDLAAYWPEAVKHKETASGVLIEPTSPDRICHLVWFRQPIVKTVEWAGDPHHKENVTKADGSLQLLPRRSFDTWVEQHKDQSAEWTGRERDSARELLKIMLDLIASQIQLSHNSKNMEIFSFAAAHDLKTPLRHIRFSLNTLEELGIASQQDEAHELIARASDSSYGLQSIIDGMMRFLEVEYERVEPASIPLDGVLNKATSLLKNELKDVEASLHIPSLPTVFGEAELLTTLFLNLLGNAVKFRSADRPLQIEVQSQEFANFVTIAVVDNGIGIPAEKAETIFEPFQRLHNYEQIPGTGLGLAICRRAAEALGGSIALDPDHQAGARIVVTLKR